MGCRAGLAGKWAGYVLRAWLVCGDGACSRRAVGVVSAGYCGRGICDEYTMYDAIVSRFLPMRNLCRKVVFVLQIRLGKQFREGEYDC